MYEDLCRFGADALSQKFLRYNALVPRRFGAESFQRQAVFVISRFGDDVSARDCKLGWNLFNFFPG